MYSSSCVSVGNSPVSMWFIRRLSVFWYPAFWQRKSITNFEMTSEMLLSFYLSVGASGKCHRARHCCHPHCDPRGCPGGKCCPGGRSTGAGHRECWVGGHLLCIWHLASSFHPLICLVLTSVVSSVLQTWKRRQCCEVPSLQWHSEDECGWSRALKMWSLNPCTECCLFVRARSISILSTYYVLNTYLIKFSLTWSR